MHWPLLILLLMGATAHAQATTTVACPAWITFNSQGQIVAAKSGKCPVMALSLQSGGNIRLQNGGRMLCQSSC